MKPILFNTEMVRAILDGRKTVTRRVCKIVINETENVKHRRCYSIEYPSRNRNGDCAHFLDAQRHFAGSANQPYRPGDILYVRETWARISDWTTVDPSMGMPDGFIYRADWPDDGEHPRWHPYIHMPKEAARLFLRVTNVRVERLKQITASQAMSEGFTDWNDFVKCWNSTIKKADRPIYGWNANPWVWVIEFERCEEETR